MAIDKFTKEQFESALPVHKETGKALWLPLGLQQGEFSYLLPISNHAGIMIRSSVDPTGTAAETGEDSIRVWLVDPTTYRPVGSKLSLYITRVNGWEKRLTAQLRKLWACGQYVRPCGCGSTVMVFKCKKEGPNQGRMFATCSQKGCQSSEFKWLD